MKIKKYFSKDIFGDDIFKLIVRNANDYEFTNKNHIKIISIKDIVETKKALITLGYNVKGISLNIDNIGGEKKLSSKKNMEDLSLKECNGFIVKEIGKNTLVLSRNGENIPFSARNFNIIELDNIDGLEGKIYNQIYRVIFYLEK